MGLGVERGDMQVETPTAKPDARNLEPTPHSSKTENRNAELERWKTIIQFVRLSVGKGDTQVP